MVASGTPSDPLFGLRNPVRQKPFKLDFTIPGQEFSTYKSIAADPKIYTLHLGSTWDIQTVVFIGAVSMNPLFNAYGKNIIIKVGGV